MAWLPSEQIRLELTTIPRGAFEQNVLRAVYWCSRANDLGRRPEHPGATADETLSRAISVIRTFEPSFEPNINWVRRAAISTRR
jgi:hypothetical protein